nr:hypothetical protein [Cellulosimicrobium cellulans]
MSLRDRGGQAGQDCPGGVLRIEGVGLASQPAVSPIGPHDLQGPDAASTDRAGQTCPVGAGALDPEGQLPAQARCPVDQLGVAAGIGGEGPGVQNGAEVVDRDRDVDVLVGVDADDDSTVRRDLLHAHGACLRPGERRWPVGWTGL